jgi:hypothetical protein
MLPLKPYLHMYRKFGLIPEPPEEPLVPYTIQTFTIYALLIPFLRKKQECTALTVRRKHGIFSMKMEGIRSKTR